MTNLKTKYGWILLLTVYVCKEFDKKGFEDEDELLYNLLHILLSDEPNK